MGPKSMQNFEGVDADEWDPTDPAKKKIKKAQRKYSFEQSSQKKAS